jgi:hypothetical protein
MFKKTNGGRPVCLPHDIDIGPSISPVQTAIDEQIRPHHLPSAIFSRFMACD